MQIEILDCKKCGYKFLPRLKNGTIKIPEKCPNRDCRASHWDTPQDMRKFNKITKPHRPLRIFPNCPQCGSGHVEFVKSYKILNKPISRYICKNCSSYFRKENPI